MSLTTFHKSHEYGSVVDRQSRAVLKPGPTVRPGYAEARFAARSHGPDGYNKDETGVVRDGICGGRHCEHRA
jgi:hypothetical protein